VVVCRTLFPHVYQGSLKKMQTAIIERVFVLNYDMIQATPLEEWRH